MSNHGIWRKDSAQGRGRWRLLLPLLSVLLLAACAGPVVVLDANNADVGRPLQDGNVLIKVAGNAYVVGLRGEPSPKFSGTANDLLFTDAACTGQPYQRVDAGYWLYGPWTWVDVSGDGALYVPDPNAAVTTLSIHGYKNQWTGNCESRGPFNLSVKPAIAIFNPTTVYTPPFRLYYR